MRQHSYSVTIEWTGDRGHGTSGYESYGREHVIRAAGHAPVLGSSEPTFRGDRDRYNPEELLLASVSACHMLWYLHLCSMNGVIVTAYVDRPHGVMDVDARGDGRFTRAVLRPTVTVAAADMIARAEALHDDAHRRCYITNSVTFPVVHEAKIAVTDARVHPMAGETPDGRATAGA